MYIYMHVHNQWYTLLQRQHKFSNIAFPIDLQIMGGFSHNAKRICTETAKYKCKLTNRNAITTYWKVNDIEEHLSNDY